MKHKKQQTNRLKAGRRVIQQPVGNVAMSIFYVQSMLNYEKNHKDTQNKSGYLVHIDGDGDDNI